ncbi:uncharacterized protein LOC119593658 [Penaeus monodon]|uniref:uncharacterized protein LOC119593658 n=1 Tax=Penaeus monodon TaxID=6687 RepID=UPI0018A762A6|nr:uncharacterized protein LOC119593658 [Penaeus monodon]
MFLATSSTKVGVTNSLSQRPGVFLNVRGVAGQVQGLHIPRSGLQLFLRVRVSEEKSANSSSSSSNKITKTVGRSRLVPASPSPTFDCEWIIEGEATRRAVLVLEIRTGSRELLNSANVVLGDLFTEPGVEGSVETWDLKRVSRDIFGLQDEENSHEQNNSKYAQKRQQNIHIESWKGLNPVLNGDRGHLRLLESNHCFRVSYNARSIYVENYILI